MSNFHIVQGGVENGDYAWLQRAGLKSVSSPWVVPKGAAPGDIVAVFVRPHGFVATAVVTEVPKLRPDWKNRYRSRLTGFRSLDPPVELEEIESLVPDFGWAQYPRSITTPDPSIAAKIQRLLARR